MAGSPTQMAEQEGGPEHTEEAPEGPPKTASDAAGIDNDQSMKDPEEMRLPDIQRPLHLGVRYYNYEGFMNRTEGDDGDYTIEVLVTRYHWEEDIPAERSRREKIEKLREQSAIEKANIASGSLAYPGAERFGEKRCLQRIRIRSRTIIKALLDLIDDDELEQSPAPFVFCRPFRLFRDKFQDMKTKLESMERNGAATARGEKASSAPVGNTLGKSPGSGERDGNAEESPDGEGQTYDTLDLDEMRCYIRFVESKILPLWSQFEERALLRRRMVRYEEIPCLMQPGGLVYVPPKLHTLHHRSARQGVWRIAECQPADFDYEFDPDTSTAGDKPDVRVFGEPTALNIYCLDCNGDTVVPLWEKISFSKFLGEREITSLECYPLAFHPDASKILSNAVDSGDRFRSCIYHSERVMHLYYSGWSFVMGILGETLEDERGEVIKYPEYFESEIVVDFHETLRSYPKWESGSGKESMDYGYWTASNGLEIPALLWQARPIHDSGEMKASALQWTSLPRSERLFSREDKLYEADAISYAKNDVFLKTREEQPDLSAYAWAPADLALLPRRIFAYVLRERKFARLDIQSIDWTSRKRQISMDDIQIKDSHRTILRSAVSSHLKSQQKEREGISTFNLDVIRGKGRGLVILLHGAPGVGKTATAEAIAMENDRPLFPITCGDLGFSPATVEKSLRDIFRYAHLWECILLLDEADVFFTQRERGGHNLEKNALVGVFLRVLEYYSGILFLTTNRVGILDEAFRSRVHISLWYKHLSLEDTVKILYNNLKRLPKYDRNQKTTDGVLRVQEKEIERFIREEYQRYAQANNKDRGPWNGRQIRNAVQIAACLALYEKESEKDDDDLPAILTAQHFRSVAETMSEFESFMKEVKVGDDTFLAKQRQERSDDFRDDGHGQEEEENPRYVGSRHHSDATAGGRSLTLGSGGDGWTGSRGSPRDVAHGRSSTHPTPSRPSQRPWDHGNGHSWEEEPREAERRTPTSTSRRGGPPPRQGNERFPTPEEKRPVGFVNRLEDGSGDDDAGHAQGPSDEWVTGPSHDKPRWKPGNEPSPSTRPRGYIWDP